MFNKHVIDYFLHKDVRYPTTAYWFFHWYAEVHDTPQVPRSYAHLDAMNRSPSFYRRTRH